MTVSPAAASTAGDSTAAVASVRQDAIDFDIAGQPLASALARYAVVADQTVLFSDALVQGRMSSPIKGRYVPQAALAALLIGTGLLAENPGGRLGDTFVLRPMAAVAAAAPAEPGLDRRYDGLVQVRVWEALCADPRTVPGSYRASLRLNIDAGGRLTQARLIGSTGDTGRDRAMVAAVNGLRLDHSPPADLRQPLLLVVMPSHGSAGSACAKSGSPPP